MKDHSGTIRGFVHFEEAWYADACRDAKIADEISIGFFGNDGCGTTGEFKVVWTEFATFNGVKLVPQLQIYDDAWDALAQCKDLIDAMAEEDNKNIPPKAFCRMLIELGFKDLTKRVSDRN